MRDARIMLNKGRPCQGMTNTIRIKAIVPETVADDIRCYADGKDLHRRERPLRRNGPHDAQERESHQILDALLHMDN